MFTNDDMIVKFPLKNGGTIEIELNSIYMVSYKHTYAYQFIKDIDFIKERFVGPWIHSHINKHLLEDGGCEINEWLTSIKKVSLIEIEYFNLKEKFNVK